MIVRAHTDVASSSPASALRFPYNASATGDETHGNPTLQGWSSLIGIITAIIGNILISFALNIQRYAHIRLSREQNGRDCSQKSRSQPESIGYGSTAQDGDASRPAERASSSDRVATGDRQSYDTESSEPSEQRPLLRVATSMEYDATFERPDEASLEKRRRDGLSKTYLRSPYWWAGIFLMTIGEAGNFIAYGFAPASIVSPLGVVALVSNCVIAPIMLKERFRLRDLGGVLVAIGGAVTIVLSAKQSEKKLGPDEILDAVTRWEFSLYMGLTSALMIVLMWASSRHGQRSILIDLGLVGLYGGYTALATKGVASLFSYTLWRALTFPITYVLLIIIISTALLQIRYVNRALQRFDSTQVIPTQFVIFTISVIIGSAILYRDFESADPPRIIKFFSGCLLTFVGVYLITSGRNQGISPEGDGGDDDNDEESVNYGEWNEDADQHDVHRRATISTVNDDWQDTVRCKTRHDTSRETLGGRSTFDVGPERLGTGMSTASYRTAPSRIATSKAQPAYFPSSYPSIGAPRLPATLSTPAVPSQDSINLSHQPSTSRLSIHSTLDSRQSVFDAVPARPSTLSQRSMAGIIPGPYLTPLSSSLVAVVADSVQQHNDMSTSQWRTTRNPRSGTGRPDPVDVPGLTIGRHQWRSSDEARSEGSRRAASHNMAEGTSL